MLMVQPHAAYRPIMMLCLALWVSRERWVPFSPLRSAAVWHLFPKEEGRKIRLDFVRRGTTFGNKLSTAQMPMLYLLRVL